MSVAPTVPDVPLQLRTRRLLLRCPREGDGGLVHDAVVESLDALRAWPASLPWAMLAPSVESSETFCRESAAAFIKRSALVYLVFDSNGDFVASTSLHAIDWAIPKFELGFWCRASRQRQGNTGEAIAALITLAVENFGARRIEALPDEENAGSRAVCERVGMMLEGVLRHERITPQGELRNTCVYAITR